MLSTNNGLVNASNLFNNVNFIRGNGNETSQIREACEKESFTCIPSMLVSSLLYESCDECFPLINAQASRLFYMKPTQFIP